MSENGGEAGDIWELIEELKQHLERHGGELPKPNEDPEFYAKLATFIDIAREEGVRVTLREIAERLGVPYGLLRSRLHSYRRQEQGYTPQPSPREYPGRQPPPEAGEPATIEPPGPTAGPEEEAGAEPSPPPAPRPPSPRGGGQQAEPSPVTKRTETRILTAAIRHLGREAEKLTKEEVELLIKIGKRVREAYERLCYMHGYDDVLTCLDEAFQALFDVVPEYEEYKERCNLIKAVAAEALKMAAPGYAALELLREAARLLGPEEALDLALEVYEEYGEEEGA